MNKLKIVILTSIGSLAIFAGLLFASYSSGIGPTQQGLGGTGTSTTFSTGSLIVQGSNGYAGATLIQGANMTINTSTPGQITFSSSGGGGGSGTISTSTNASIGKVAIWTGLATLGNGSLLDNGTVAGISATSSTVNFNIQGSTILNPFNVSSSSGTSLFKVTSGGNIQIGTTSANSILYTDSQNNITSTSTPLPISLGGTGTTTLQSLTLPISVANGGTGANAYTANDILFGNGTNPLATSSSLTWDGTKFTTTNASTSALTVSGQSYLATTSIIGTLSLTGIPTFSGVSNCNGVQFVQITSGLFGCGTPSGGGGGSGGGWATTTPGIIYTAFGTTVGINTTTPPANLTVVGISASTTPVLLVASSSGATLLSVSASPITQINIGSSTAGTLANVYIQGSTASTTIPILQVASSSGTTLFQIKANGDVLDNEITSGSIMIGGASGLLTNSSLSQSAGTTFINGATPIIDGGGDYLNNIIQTSGSNFIVQTIATSTAVFGNLIQSGGVQFYQVNTNLTATQFCSGGLFNESSSTALTITFPTLTQIGTSPCGGSQPIASQFAQQFGVNSGSAAVTLAASGSGETLMYAPGSGPSWYPGQIQGTIGQFIATSTLTGATSTGMSFSAYLQTFQPTSTAPTQMGQILSADATNHGWQLTNLVAGTNVTITTTTPGQITIAASGGGGSGTISTSTNASIGKVAIWTGLATLGNGSLLDNGTVAGINATSSTINFNLQGNGTLDPFNVASSSGTSILRVTALSTIGIGTTTPVATLSIQGTSGQTISLFNIASSTGASVFDVSSNSNTQLQIGTTTPATLATLYIQGSTASTTLPLLMVASSTATNLFVVKANGDLVLNTVNYTFPISQGVASTTLANNGSGNLSWSPAFAFAGATSTASSTTFTNTSGSSTLVSLTFSLPAAQRVMINGLFPNIKNSSNAQNCQLNAYIDKTNQGIVAIEDQLNVTAILNSSPANFSYVSGQLASGSHTIDITGLASATTCTIQFTQLTVFGIGN